MEVLKPHSPEELARMLGAAANERKILRLGGAFSKDAMAGPLNGSDCVLSTSHLRRVLQYEPRDLTISVEAGMPWAELTRRLAEHRQMIPLDPPFFHRATVGGVVAANCSGPRRRLYGTARDVVIGLKFATLEGKLVQSGGMVVKNVAGLDMAKLMIGSFGTLAAIAVVNFKLAPIPEATRTFILRFGSLDAAMEARDRIVRSVLQPAAVDLLNPAASGRAKLEGWTLLVQTGGNRSVLNRYARELENAEALEGEAESAVWDRVREFTPAYLAEHPKGMVLRISTTLTGVRGAMANASGPAIARAANGVVYRYFESPFEPIWSEHRGAIEFCPSEAKDKLQLWPIAGSDFAIMERVKQLFDPNKLLNPGRLYGRI